MAPDPEPRIGDAEREAAVRALGEHFVAGRLTKEEHDERAEVALRARTASDLRPLFSDLPRLGAVRETAGSGERGQADRPRDRRPAVSGVWLSVPVMALLVCLGLLVAVSTRHWWVLFVVGGFFWCRPRGGRWRRD